MIRAGDSIENPVTGERLVFRQTSRETNGEAVVIETYVQPNGFVAAAHVHPGQEERFEVLRGTVGFRVGREKLVAGPGKRLTVPAGTPHKFWNAGDDVAHFVLRDPARAAVRVADRDDVLARRRRQDEPEGHAEPAAARGDRAGALRHGSAAVPAGDRAADRARARQPARPCVRLPARLRPRAAPVGRPPRRRSLMRRGLFIAGRPRLAAARGARGGDLARRSIRSKVRAPHRLSRTPSSSRKEHRLMNNSDNRRWALVGPLSVALWVVGIILINNNGPADHSTGAQILAWYKSDSDTIVLGGWLFMLGCLGFVTFVAGLRVRLAEATGPGSQLPGSHSRAPRWPPSAGCSSRPSTSRAGSTRTTSTRGPPRPSITPSTSSSSAPSSQRSCRSPRSRSSPGGRGWCRAGGPASRGSSRSC